MRNCKAGAPKVKGKVDLRCLEWNWSNAPTRQFHFSCQVICRPRRGVWYGIMRPLRLTTKVSQRKRGDLWDHRSSIKVHECCKSSDKVIDKVWYIVGQTETGGDLVVSNQKRPCTWQLELTSSVHHTSWYTVYGYTSQRKTMRQIAQLQAWVTRFSPLLCSLTVRLSRRRPAHTYCTFERRLLDTITVLLSHGFWVQNLLTLCFLVICQLLA
jgi:hypothetical protein